MRAEPRECTESNLNLRHKQWGSMTGLQRHISGEFLCHPKMYDRARSSMSIECVAFRARSMEQQIVHWKLGERWPACCNPSPAASNMERQLCFPKVCQNVHRLQQRVNHDSMSSGVCFFFRAHISQVLMAPVLPMQGTFSVCQLLSKQQHGLRVHITPRCLLSLGAAC